MEAGAHTFVLDRNELTPGLYTCQFINGGRQGKYSDGIVK
jgi:hypothetical protein